MQYYVQNVERGYVGNNILFWRKGGHGYTCHLSEAEVFEDNDPHLIGLSKGEKYRIWEKSYIDSVAHLAVDSESLDVEKAGLEK